MRRIRKSHTLDTLCKRIGGRWVSVQSFGNWKCILLTCYAQTIAEGHGKTQRKAVRALEEKLLALAKEILSEEWDFPE